MKSNPASSPMEHRVVLAGIVLLHIAVVVVLIRTGVIPPENLPQVLRATLIVPTPPQPEPPRPRPPLPRPKPAPPQRVQPLPVPVLAATVTAPSPVPAPPAITAAPVVAVAPAPAPVSPPRFDADYLDNPKPAYPPVARRMHEEGKVVMRVFVEADGRPSRVDIQHSSGSPRLDEAASSAVSRWKFIPARQGGEAVAAWVLVPIIFRLEN